MPLYDFKCNACSSARGEDYSFTLSMLMSADRSVVPCDSCGQTESVIRLFDIPAFHNGMTAGEKSAGTTKQRFESGKFMRDERAKRKRAYGPNTREGQSNELWAGPLPEGIKAPKK